MIFVAVGQHQRLELALPAFQIGEVRYDQIDPGQIRLGKHRAGVDDDSRPLTRDRHHVEAELAKAAERHDIDWRRAGRHRLHRGHTHAYPSGTRRFERIAFRVTNKATGDPGGSIRSPFQAAGSAWKAGGISSETIA